jgi:succinate dehydrogenase/fumarate reductase flavoprotein subunit
MDIPEHDLIVVGAGNAATCAALSAEGGDAKFPQNREFFAIYQGMRSGHAE